MLSSGYRVADCSAVPGIALQVNMHALQNAKSTPVGGPGREMTVALRMPVLLSSQCLRTLIHVPATRRPAAPTPPVQTASALHVSRHVRVEKSFI